MLCIGIFPSLLVFSPTLSPRPRPTLTIGCEAPFLGALSLLGGLFSYWVMGPLTAFLIDLIEPPP